MGSPPIRYPAATRNRALAANQSHATASWRALNFRALRLLLDAVKDLRVGNSIPGGAELLGRQRAAEFVQRAQHEALAGYTAVEAVQLACLPPHLSLQPTCRGRQVTFKLGAQRIALRGEFEDLMPAARAPRPCRSGSLYQLNGPFSCQ
jgi:hypothetical protein